MNKPEKPLARPEVRTLKPYMPGKPIWEVQEELGLERVVKLASNENPLGPSPFAKEAVARAIDDLHRYPDAQSIKLKEALAAHYGFSADQIAIGNGADELITLISETFLQQGDEVIIPSPSFTEYSFGAELMGAVPVYVPLDSRFLYVPEHILQAVTPRTKLIYLISPHNPAGTIIGREKVRALLGQLPPGVLVVLDSAYAHYAVDPRYTDGMEFVREGYPVMVLQTFSKIYGLDGIRVGYAVSSKDVIADLHRCKEPFNVNLLAQAAAAAALADTEHVRASLSVVESGRKFLYAAFERLGLPYTRSSSNFILVHAGPQAAALYEGLLLQGVIVRPGAVWGLPEHLRITIGSETENRMLAEALERVLLDKMN